MISITAYGKLSDYNDKLIQAIDEMNNMDMVDWMDQEKRRNNVIVKELPITTPDVDAFKERMHQFPQATLEMDIQLRRARKLGYKICLLELGSSDDNK